MSDLEELARKASEVRQERQAEVDAQAASDQDDWSRRAAMSVSDLGLLAGPVGLVPFIGVWLGLTLLLSSVWEGGSGKGAHDSCAEAGTGLAAIVIAAALWLMTRRAVRALLRRKLAAEMQWLLALPFTVEGYERLLSQPGSTDFNLRLSFEGKADLAFLKDAAVGLGLKEPVEEGSETVLPQLINTYHSPESQTSNGLARRRFHRLVDELLLPAHQRFPISRARVEIT